jgi:NAD(P)-dependent dehydrogenase (short-subunit alcohol dehydrogenase family)
LDLFKLEGKIALVTGGGQGIGRTLALALAQAGADVAVADINDKTGEKVAREITDLGKRSVYIRTDVTKPEEVQGMVETTVAELGALDIAVNSAFTGGKYTKPILSEDFPLEDWDFIHSLTLRGVFVCCAAEAKAMIPRARGKIINIASVSARIANAGVAYSAAKAGVVMLTRRLAADWGKYNINVNSISPSYTLSPAMKNMTEEARDRMRSFHPMGWFERPEDMAGTVVYLASQASDYVTGRDLVVDGGYTLNAWLNPPARELPPLVSREEEARSLIHDLEVLGLAHDEKGVVHG